VLDDAESAARRGAELISDAARAALEARGAFSLALSGGRTPRLMISLIDADALAAEAVSIFQVDERIAPDGDPDRNLSELDAGLAPSARSRLHPMPVTDGDLEAAAARYEAELPPSLDLVHLGLGPDGHTASLVPGDDVLEVRDRRVALTGGEYQGRRRMTLTYPALEAARRIFWLVTGADKREALARLVTGDRSIPAGPLAGGDTLVIADRAAAKAIEPR
jgi:6-phosphogluconolactonase